MKKFIALIALLTAMALPAGAPAEETPLKPMILASISDGTIADRLAPVKSALQREKFQIVGEYAPYDGAYVVVVTGDRLRQNAAKTVFGGYGAVVRVSLTETGDKVQVAFTDPVYMANAYRMAGDLSGVRLRLDAALGRVAPFGSKKGLTPEKLRKYHYMFAMPYFDDHIRLAEYGSQAQAVEAVESGLAKGAGETVRVYRIDIPGKDEALFGVGIRGGRRIRPGGDGRRRPRGAETDLPSSL